MSGPLCPYLDTVDRSRLDFDFEKICSISLTTFNVYACLVCGRFLQGRGRGSPAYFHALNEDHHVYINLHTCKMYCLPDNYQVIDSSLSDIVGVLNPFFSTSDIRTIDSTPRTVPDLTRTLTIVPGFVGLNNIKTNDYANVVFQAFSHIQPIRDFFLQRQHEPSSHLVRCFGELTRKIWNLHPFRGQVSPHELLQAISTESNKRFSLSKQQDTYLFLIWFLDKLKSGLSSDGFDLFSLAFKGTIRVVSRKPVDPSFKSFSNFQEPPTSKESPFFALQLDLPPSPLFQDTITSRNIIPQVSIFDLLTKYNHSEPQDLGNMIKNYRLLTLPPYLIMHVNRFRKNQWFLEKSSTIVHFPLEGLEINSESGTYFYRIIANIVFEGEKDPTNGSYKIYLLNKATNQWIEIQDLSTRVVQPQTVFISESYIQVF